MDILNIKQFINREPTMSSLGHNRQHKVGSFSNMTYYDLTFFRMVDVYQCFRIQVTGGKLEAAS